MGDGPVDIKLEETGELGTTLVGEKSLKDSAAVYLNMCVWGETDGAEMYLTRAQVEQFRDWLTLMLAG